MKIIEPQVTLLHITPNAAQTIERAGRTCYKSEDKITPTSAAQFCRKLKDLGHLSVFEHAIATFHIICDRGVTHEIVRHRIASFSQESTRYVNYKEGITVIMPKGLTVAQFKRRVALMEHIERVYCQEIEEGQAPQIARGVLPTQLKSEIVWSANFREWLQVIIPQRAQKPAHPQMVEIVGEGILPILRRECPEVFA